MNNKFFNSLFWPSLFCALSGTLLISILGIRHFSEDLPDHSQDISAKNLSPDLSEWDDIGRLKRKINLNGKEQLGDQFIGASRKEDRIEISKQTNLIRTGNPQSLNKLAKSDCTKALSIFGIGPINILDFDPVDILYSDEQAPEPRLFHCDVMAKQERDRHIKLER